MDNKEPVEFEAGEVAAEEEYEEQEETDEHDGEKENDVNLSNLFIVFIWKNFLENKMKHETK